MYLLKYLLGFVVFKVKGKRTQVLINQLRKDVALSDITAIAENKLSFCCFFKDRIRVTDQIKKLGLEIEEQTEGGLYVFLLKHKNRWAIGITSVVLLALIYVSSFFVWEIRVEGNENVSDNEIKLILYEIGFREGILKKSVKTDSLVNNFLLKESRISWIAVNFDGTVAHVEVREAATDKKIEKKENVNLVASHSGIIIRADALSGTSLVKEGDAVVKGQMLVSAYMPKKTGGELLKGALGYVWAQTFREFEIRVPLTYSEKQYTGKTNKKYTLVVLGKELPVFQGINRNFQLCDFEKEIKRIKIQENKAFPFEIKSEVYREYKVYTKRRTKKEAAELAREEVKKSLEEKCKNFSIVENKEEIKIENNCLVLCSRVECIEDIAKELEFEVS